MKDSMKKVIMTAPLLLAFIWMSGLIFTTGIPMEDEMMAPSSVDNLVTIIFSFIVVYSIVLVVLFYMMNKAIVTKKKTERKNTAKKVKKKKK